MLIVGLGLILLLIGFFIKIPILITLGIIALIIGIVLLIVGSVGSSGGGGRRWW